MASQMIQYKKEGQPEQMFTVQLMEVVHESEEVRTFKFNIPKGYRWQAGANTHLAFHGFLKEDGPDKNLVRHMSINTLYEEGYIGITTRIPNESSAFKRRMETMKVGDDLYLFGGSTRMPMDEDVTSAVFISMGVGFSSFRPKLMEIAAGLTNIERVVSINISREKNRLYHKELRKLQQTDMIIHQYQERRGFLKEIEREMYRSNKSKVAKDFYIVGSDEFISSIYRKLIEDGIDLSRIHLDKKDNYLMKHGLI
jgi:ferredoxin--NADP+ reductase